MTSEQATFPTGWLGIDAIQRAQASGVLRLMDAAPWMRTRDLTSKDPILLYRAWREVLGADPDYPAQQIGDCVSFGHGHANDLLQCVEITLGEASEYRETDTEFVYATSREVAGILGNSDGSYGAAAIKAMTTVGIVSREMLGAAGAYSGQRAKTWGRYGAPEEAKRAAAPYRLGMAAQVKSWDELVAALSSGYPVTISTGRGFNLERDRDGFCYETGSWGHCMFVAGVRFDKPGALIVQSWGPKTPTGPLAMDQPTFSFWAQRATVSAILAEGDSFVLSKSPEFIKRPLPRSWKYEDAA